MTDTLAAFDGFAETLTMREDANYQWRVARRPKGNVVPEDFTLSDKNIAETQKKMPNRNGMTMAHAMWPGKEFGSGAKEFGGTAKPDTQGSSCMSNCATEAKVASLLPEYARNAHGNLAEQTRTFGPSVGADTTKPVASTGAAAKKAVAVPVAAAKVIEKSTESAAALKSADVTGILTKNTCTACHGVENKIIGPSFREIAAKQGGKADAVAYLTDKIKSGGSGVYGVMPMPAQSINDADAKKVATWLSQGAAK